MIDPQAYQAKSKTRVSDTTEFIKSPAFTHHLLVPANLLTPIWNVTFPFIHE